MSNAIQMLIAGVLVMLTGGANLVTNIPYLREGKTTVGFVHLVIDKNACRTS